MISYRWSSHSEFAFISLVALLLANTEHCQHQQYLAATDMRNQYFDYGWQINGTVILPKAKSQTPKLESRMNIMKYIFCRTTAADRIFLSVQHTHFQFAYDISIYILHWKLLLHTYLLPFSHLHIARAPVWVWVWFISFSSRTLIIFALYLFIYLAVVGHFTRTKNTFCVVEFLSDADNTASSIICFYRISA